MWSPGWVCIQFLRARYSLSANVRAIWLIQCFVCVDLFGLLVLLARIHGLGRGIHVRFSQSDVLFTFVRMAFVRVARHSWELLRVECGCMTRVCVIWYRVRAGMPSGCVARSEWRRMVAVSIYAAAEGMPSSARRALCRQSVSHRFGTKMDASDRLICSSSMDACWGVWRKGKQVSVVESTMCFQSVSWCFGWRPYSCTSSFRMRV